MSVLKYRVALGEAARMALQKRIRRGHDSARVLMRARVLLKSDDGMSETVIAQALDITSRTVSMVRKRFFQEGLERALFDKPRPGAQRKLDGKQEAFLIAVACSKPPEGREHWTLKLLANEVVQLDFAESISPETVRQVLKKATSSRGKRNNGASLR